MVNGTLTVRSKSAINIGTLALSATAEEAKGNGMLVMGEHRWMS